jgi:sporulation protein YlmC with PRC-barrel domain
MIGASYSFCEAVDKGSFTSTQITGELDYLAATTLFAYGLTYMLGLGYACGSSCCLHIKNSNTLFAFLHKRYTRHVMLTLSETLLKRPVMSLRTGEGIATIEAPVINPNNLKIEGFYCSTPASKQFAVLLTQDIRDIIRQGFVVNDAEVLTDPEELVRLKKTLDINFQLEGKPVITATGEKVGKISDWATETTTFYIQKLYVGRSMLKSFSQGQLSIDRNQIIEITNKKIVIQDILKATKSSVPVTAPST